MSISLPELTRFRQRLATLASKPGAIPDGRLLSGIQDQITLDAFSGVDINCVVLFPQEQPDNLVRAGINPNKTRSPALRQFAELQTITISSARSVSPIRRIGETHVHKYARGGRTIAGSMIFTNFNRDVFADFYNMHPGDSFLNSSTPFHVDQIPEFHVIISAANEYGTFANMALINVTLTNFGTTMSVHDLIVESSYTYVAQLMMPFVSNSLDFTKSVQFAIALGTQLDSVALSSAMDEAVYLSTLSPLYGFDVATPADRHRDALEIYEAWKGIRE
jgi:hypothetical protein